jgi:8-oxo-dGTP pyrophosphatase MutT (NUDIX family)
MNKNNNICNNCGKLGHLFHQCKLPIISFGLIVFKINNSNQIEYLMIRRKHSFGFIDFVRGKYNLNNIEYIQNIINEMSNTEKNILKISDFKKIWSNLWNNHELKNNQYKYEEIISQKKFESLKNIKYNDEKNMLDYLIDNSITNWNETEWEFPKGRKNNNENDIECALREFEEETGIVKSKIILINNLLPFEEIYIGTNFKSYKHKYFLGLINNDEMIDSCKFQENEVSSVEWKTIDKCLETIRPYNLEKKQIIININKILQEYRLY